MSEPATTRRSLHGIAELLLAGPQHRAAGTIRLRVVPGGFTTVAMPSLRLDGDHLVCREERIPLDGRTFMQVAASVGVHAAAPAEVYSDGSGVAQYDEITLDPEALMAITTAFEHGDQALRQLAPELEPVLWPEHFDVGITVDEVNYGVSPGDSAVGEPYAYVGPHRPRHGTFWNVPFGAARPVRELGEAVGILAFFTEGRQLASSD